MSIMALTADQATAINAPVDGFDGGLWTDGERNFVLFATQTWAMRDGNGDWVPAVALQPQSAEGSEPFAYVMGRSEFLAAFAAIPTE